MDGMFLTLLLNPATSDSVEITLGTRLAIGIRVGILAASMPFIYFAMFRLLRWLRSRDSMPRGVTRFQAAFILAFAAVFLFEKSSFAYAWVERDLEITNVRSIMGPFYEIETSSPGAELAPGEGLTHTQAVVHLQGNDKMLAPIVQQVFKTDLEVIKRVFR